MSEVKSEMLPISDNPKTPWRIPSKELEELQKGDLVCARILKQMDRQGEKALYPYYKEEGVLKKYVHDNKQSFKTTVVPQAVTKTALKLAHDELGHNGMARTCMLLRRNYYWRGMKPDVVRYVK